MLKVFGPDLAGDLASPCAQAYELPLRNFKMKGSAGWVAYGGLGPRLHLAHILPADVDITGWIEGPIVTTYTSKEPSAGTCYLAV